MTGVALARLEPWTVEELLDLPDDGQRHEIMDGALLMSPAPGLRHQLVADRLRQLLSLAAPQGVEAVSACNVRLRDDRTVFVPDTVVFAVEDVAGRRVLEAEEVLAVVEVVSPSSRRLDRMVKPSVYAEAGVPCLWRVELGPFPGQGTAELPVVLVHRLVDGGYREVARLSAGSRGATDAPYPVDLDPADLLRRR